VGVSEFGVNAYIMAGRQICGVLSMATGFNPAGLELFQKMCSRRRQSAQIE
jgi:hypothetical protein